MTLRVGGIVVSAGGGSISALIRSLRVSDPGNETLEITADGSGTISVTISSSSIAAWDGTYTQDIDGNAINETNLLAGPMCLVAPVIPSAAPTVGDSVTKTSGGLWLSAADDLVIEQDWRVGGTVRSPEFAHWGDTYRPRFPDVGSPVDLLETATDSNGTRTADSNNTGNVVGISPTAITKFIVIGASVIEQTGGKSLVTTNSTMTSAIQGAPYNHSGVEVYSYGMSASDLAHTKYMLKVAREKHPDSTLIVHHGGGNVTSYRPYSTAAQSEKDYFQSQWEDIIAEANALGGEIYFGSISYRSYSGVTPESPDGGSKPFNEVNDRSGSTGMKGLIPIITSDQTSAMSLTLTGRPFFDFYRKVLENFETWLEGPSGEDPGDNVHPSVAGEAGLRAYIVEIIDHILDGTEPSDITERTVT